MSEIMKTIDQRETRKKKTKTEKNKGDKGHGERVGAKWFCCAFKHGTIIRTGITCKNKKSLVIWATQLAGGLSLKSWNILKLC